MAGWSLLFFFSTLCSSVINTIPQAKSPKDIRLSLEKIGVQARKLSNTFPHLEKYNTVITFHFSLFCGVPRGRGPPHLSCTLSSKQRRALSLGGSLKSESLKMLVNALMNTQLPTSKPCTTEKGIHQLACLWHW